MGKGGIAGLGPGCLCRGGGGGVVGGGEGGYSRAGSKMSV